MITSETVRQEGARDMQRYAELAGKTQAIVDLYERHPDLGFARLKAAVAEFQAEGEQPLLF